MQKKHRQYLTMLFTFFLRTDYSAAVVSAATESAATESAEQQAESAFTQVVSAFAASASDF